MDVEQTNKKGMKMKLTKEEEDLVRERRKRNKVKRPKYSGTLKQDLYVLRAVRGCEGYRLTLNVNIDDIIAEHGGYVPSSAFPKILKKFKKEINNLAKIPKGTEFFGYVNEVDEVDEVDEVRWSNMKEDDDDLFGEFYTDLSSEWAEKNLENIAGGSRKKLKAFNQVEEKISR